MAQSAREISRLLKPLRKRLWSKWDLNGRMTVPVWLWMHHLKTSFI